MKKYILLFIATILSIAIIFTTGSAINAAVEVSGIRLKPSEGENTVVTSGRLQYLNEENIKSNNYMLIDKIYQSDGDKVKKGQAVMSVYEITDITSITESFPDASNYLKLVSGTEIGDDIANEIKKYAKESIVRSPSDGIITSISYKENYFAVKGSIIFRISDNNTRCVKANINEGYIEKIKTGQSVRIRFPAISNEVYNGTVSVIAKEAKQTGVLTGKETSVEVIIKLDKFDDKLKIGYTAECTIITSVDNDIIMIPYEYIHSDERGDYVFIYKKNRSIKTYVKPGNEYKNGVQITEGLKENDTIIKPENDIADGTNISLVNGDK